jgi:transposase-like protein
MVAHLVYYHLALLALTWLFVMLHRGWPRRSATPPPAQDTPLKPKRTRSKEPKAFEGLRHKPYCALCERAPVQPQAPPPTRPAPMPPTNQRSREVATSMHFCPRSDCAYRGWLELGHVRANGHPGGGPWRQFYCTSCQGYFLETPGTICHGKQAGVEHIGCVLACLAEGLGIRATARVFEVAPHTVLQWLGEAAEQLRACAGYFLCAVHVEQLQLDELYAVLREVKAGELSDDEAFKRLEGSRHRVWTAIDPVSKLLLAIEVGPRTLEMAQRVGHRVAQRFASSCLPAWFSDGCKGYLPAILGHCGLWVHPERRHDKGPWPKPRWMPLPGLL